MKVFRLSVIGLSDYKLTNFRRLRQSYFRLNKIYYLTWLTIYHLCQKSH